MHQALLQRHQMVMEPAPGTAPTAPNGDGTVPGGAPTAPNGDGTVPGTAPTAPNGDGTAPEHRSDGAKW